MKLISINVGRPQEVEWKGKTVSTAIFKSSVDGPIQLRTLNLDGDGQADLSGHGGPSKAVYAYSMENYDYWRNELSEMELTWGHFGENFTTEGLEQENLYIGDTLRIGSALLQVTEPRVPCFKLDIRFGQNDMVKRFFASKRSGTYLSVLEEGTVEAGNTISIVKRSTHGITVADINRLFAHEKDDWVTMKHAVELEDLSEAWRRYFRKQLEKHEDGATNGN